MFKLCSKQLYVKAAPGGLPQTGLLPLSRLMATQTPPPDAARGATADLCDTFITESVDIVNQGKVQIMNPVFRDFGGNLRFKGPAATVKCFENNPLVRKARHQRFLCACFGSIAPSCLGSLQMLSLLQ